MPKPMSETYSRWRVATQCPATKYSCTLTYCIFAYLLYFSDTIYSRLATEYNSLVLASVNCFDDFIGKKKHIKTDATKESSVKNNVGVCSRNVSDQKPCCKVTEVDNKLNDVSLNDECRTNNSHCRYVYLILYYTRKILQLFNKIYS